MTFVFDNSNREFDEVNNEKIQSVELGYSYSSQFFSANVNGYYTIWNNRPTSVSLIDPNDPSNSFNTTAIGMSARHMGIEFDGVYKITRQIQLEGMANIADWEWISEATAATYNSDGSLYNQQRVDPRGVKVADAAQNTFGAAVRYEPIKHLYIKPQFNYFGKNYANLNLNDYAASYKNGVESPNKNVGRQAWKMPDYFLLDINAGYSMKVWKLKLDLRVSVINALNRFYISDAQNNSYTTDNDFNAACATVNVGMGRRWQVSLVATF